ncbi:hypothetical protein BT96DRAFT_797375, partial [Gymnopus androsaceus JB14]
IHPLTALDIEEASIKGNAEVDEVVVGPQGLDLRARVHRFWERVRLIAGDQLSIARLRALEAIRAGQEAGYGGFGWGVWIPGLFHAKMADVQGFFTTHFGKPSSSIQDPGSLHFHNTLLERLPITITSLPNFQTCRSLIFVSLYARVLHCLLKVSGKATLAEYADSVGSWDQLYHDVERIYITYTDASVVAELRSKRELLGKEEGDMVFENAILFLRDALITREFTDAVRAGDSGRVILVLKIWALSFRGNGRTKYAYEMLHLIHNLENVWPQPVRDAVLNNWLISTNGRSFLEVDLMQEHLNYWIKVFYKAHGSNMSWRWLAMITPCVNALRELARTMNDALGYDQGSKHTSVDPVNDIHCIMESLDDRGTYDLTLGRVLEDDQEVADATSVGLHNTITGTSCPLNEFNSACSRLQRRRRMIPV